MVQPFDQLTVDCCQRTGISRRWGAEGIAFLFLSFFYCSGNSFLKKRVLAGSKDFGEEGEKTGFLCVGCIIPIGRGQQRPESG